MPTAAELLTQLGRYRVLIAERRLESADELFQVMVNSLQGVDGMDVQKCADLVPSEHPEGWSPLEMSRYLQARLRAEGREGTAVDLTAPEDRAQLGPELEIQIIAAWKELAELHDFLPWKRWKTYADDHITDEVLVEMRYEAIDLHHFLNNIYLLLGMDDEMVAAYYHAKVRRNIERQETTYAVAEGS